LIKDDYLAYKGDVGGLAAFIYYNFISGVLHRGEYIFTEKHSNKSLYISDYREVRKLLTSKYGEPQLDDILWANPLFKDDSSKWGTAVSIGHLMYHAQWETGTTLIDLYLSGDNYKISHVLFYVSKAHKRAAEEAKRKRKLDDL